MNKVILVALVVLCSLLDGVSVSAQTHSSSNYQVQESSFNAGSGNDSTSASFSARGSVGDLGVGRADSNSYSARVGFINPREEFLELVVQSASIDMGVLDTTVTGYGSGIFYVRSYINGDYSVQTMSPSMTSESGEVLDPISSAATSSAGVEQFGINLVSNTCPPAAFGCLTPLGANPAADPSTSFANGEAAPGYDTAGSYQYNQNDIIAQSGTVGPAWGRTNFTISYIANVSSITPAGLYEIDHDIVVVPTF